LERPIFILVAEDEALIQVLLGDALQEAGLSVVTADDGEAAISIIDEKHAVLAGLVSDIRLADGPDGWAVARHAREHRPDLPVVYITGDSAADWAVNGVPKSTLVQKPFAAAQVITAISTLLNEAGS
jgi:DNA-binding NtrC family response regulator